MLRDPVRAIKEISHDRHLQEAQPALENGKKMTAVEIQAEYLEMALRYAASRPTDPGSTRTSWQKWQHVIECLAEDPMDARPSRSTG